MPELVLTSSLSPRTCGMCFCSGYSSRVAPLRCPLRFTGASMSFSNSDAKVLLFSDICKFSGKKMQSKPLFRKYTNKERNKKSDPKGSLFC